MDDGLKQRIVGAVVLLALGTLFVPVLFEPEHRRHVDRTTQVSPAPGIKPLKVEPPVRPEGIEPAKPAQEMYQLVEEPKEDQQLAEEGPMTNKLVPEPTAKQKQILDDKGIPKAWAVQVASFKTEERAKVLRDQLLDDGYPAFTRTLETTKGKVTRVYVGPKIERAQAAKIKAELDKSLKIDSLMVRFAP